MRITHARRIAQVFFFALFAWLCLVATVGTRFWQWRGWPIRWFLELDPLVALGTALTTHSLYPALSWALAVIVLTVLFGRVFCGWICPFGSIHHFVSWLARRSWPLKRRMEANRYRPAQVVKYCILAALLSAAALPAGRMMLASLQTGLLDPIPLVNRSFNLAALSIGDLAAGRWPGASRFCSGAGLIGAIFLAFVLLNVAAPRFYCRFVCPLGALLGIIGSAAPWGVGARRSKCTECGVCDLNCAGACNPMGPIRLSECLMCMNCLDDCPAEGPVNYGPRPSPAGEIVSPGMSRRDFVVSVAAGLAVAPLARLGGRTAGDWPAGMIRPPGSVAEEEFLARCVKCSECVKVCPTNVLQPAGFGFGLEALWTPVLNNRVGVSGCQSNCIACGRACPTGAIRPMTLDEKLGQGEFKAAGPIRIGLAYVDRGRCLPWAMERPCIVCEETCPVSPKAIRLEEVEETTRDGAKVRLQRPVVDPGRCIGCGVCEHECPMSGLRAIRVTADNETRDRNHAVLLRNEN
ncbi:MAG: 4Fe-4S binding protein [Opitutaceae bacterium]|jgi:MauM/NapG family ferredoxin protein